MSVTHPSGPAPRRRWIPRTLPWRKGWTPPQTTSSGCGDGWRRRAAVRWTRRRPDGDDGVAWPRCQVATPLGGHDREEPDEDHRYAREQLDQYADADADQRGHRGSP